MATTEETLAKVSQTLDDVTKIVGQITPLAALTVAGFKALSAFMHRNEQDVKTFDAAIAEYETQQAALKAAIDEFHQKYPTSA